MMRRLLILCAAPLALLLGAMAPRPAIVPADFEPRPAEYACPAQSQFVPVFTLAAGQPNPDNSALRRDERYASNGGWVVAMLSSADLPLTATARAALNDSGVFDPRQAGVPDSDTSALANDVRAKGSAAARLRLLDVRARHAYRWERHAPCLSRAGFLALKATAEKSFVDNAHAAFDYQRALSLYQQAGGGGATTR